VETSRLNADARDRKVTQSGAESLLDWLKISENLCWFDSFLFEKPKYLPKLTLVGFDSSDEARFLNVLMYESDQE
jgi:hypothetical protein